MVLGGPSSTLEGLLYPYVASARPRQLCVALAASALPLLDCASLKPLCVVLAAAPLASCCLLALESKHSLSQYYSLIQEIPPEILSKPALEF